MSKADELEREIQSRFDKISDALTPSQWAKAHMKVVAGFVAETLAKHLEEPDGHL